MHTLRSLITLCTIIFVLSTTLVSAKLTPEEKRILRENADAADRSIRHVDHADVESFVANGVHLLFFGAVWCRFTQRFTPKWLEIQEEFDRRGWNQIPNFKIAKVECSNDELFCTKKHHVSGYPTLNLYIHGHLVNEYKGQDEKDEILHFLSWQKENALPQADLVVPPMASVDVIPAPVPVKSEDVAHIVAAHEQNWKDHTPEQVHVALEHEDDEVHGVAQPSVEQAETASTTTLAGIIVLVTFAAAAMVVFFRVLQKKGGSGGFGKPAYKKVDDMREM
ncbi:Thioredoxin domain-containing protein 5 [Blyttiomyces sp. JEL0837]|nr:Thioredoxin domain-containing protein 5 [Blyttiomyces sp. JEL0837]